jgi:LytS/YehU family sensor histidine kinase
MSKPVLGLLLGAVLGLLDGMGAYAYPEVRDQIVGIMIGSTFKGLVTGLATGFFATKLKSLPLGMLIGLAIGCLLSYIVAAMPDPNNPGKHFYLEIMLPGSILGAVVGYATYRFGRAPRRDAATA